MGEYTPGPWEWTRDDSLAECEAFCLRGRAGLIVLDALDEDDRGPFISSSIANLRLVAASPNLLAACEAVVRYADHLADPIQYEDAKSVLSKCQAAIAKAKGK